MDAQEPKKHVLSTFRMHLLVAPTTTTLAFIAVIALSLFIPLASHLDRQGVSEIGSAGIAEHFLYLHSAFWPVALCSLVGCVASALLLYRKMTEPLTRFVSCFDRIGRGEVPEQVVIRSTDYLSDEADALNEMLVQLGERERERSDSRDELDRIADQILTRCAGDAEVAEWVTNLRNLKGLR